MRAYPDINWEDTFIREKWLEKEKRNEVAGLLKENRFNRLVICVASTIAVLIKVLSFGSLFPYKGGIRQKT
ncbi:MAG: hypothetical protein ACE5KZ_01950 [Candidatus Scalinduaceae bacterium]